METLNGNLNPSKLTYTTRCKMLNKDGQPCGFPIVDHPLNVEIVGQPDAKVQKFIGALMSHLQKRHPEAFQVGTLQAQLFFGYLALSAFDSPDPKLNAMKQNFENTLRRMVTPAPVTDDEIEGACAALQMSMDDPHREPFKNALKHLRDYYEGRTPKAPASTPAAPVVTH